MNLYLIDNYERVFFSSKNRFIDTNRIIGEQTEIDRLTERNRHIYIYIFFFFKKNKNRSH